MTGVVLDSSAVLALFLGEPGAESVMPVIAGAMLCSVNYAEIISKLVERGAMRDVASFTVQKVGIVVVDFGVDLADRTGELRAQTRHLGLSLADRACLALAEREGLPVLTADRSWSAVDVGVDIRLIR